jgi:hypothetical protein
MVGSPNPFSNAWPKEQSAQVVRFRLWARNRSNAAPLELAEN